MLVTMAAAQRDRAQRDRAERDRWHYVEELLASLIETVDHGNRMYFKANFKGKTPKPVEIHRPGANNTSSTEAEADKPKLTRAAMRAILLGG